MASSMRSNRQHLASWPVTHVPAHDRRIGDKILIAFDHACLQNDLEIAALLLIEYERIVTRPPITRDAPRRLEMERLVAAHSRLWELLRADAEVEDR